MEGARRGGQRGDEDKATDIVPKPTWRTPPTVIPKEDSRTGTNRYPVFRVQRAGRPWMRLPKSRRSRSCRPAKSRKFFTGYLDAPVISYPPFPGNEANYLQAPDARISASRIQSPRLLPVW